MATQDFISGGYIGKLGETVGQRWHNKRIIRSYVLPQNPNTPAQQANRGQFAHATRLAQAAMNINKGHHSWDTTEKGEFCQRVSVARKRLQSGMPDDEALPLYPDGYTPPIVLPNVNYGENPQTYERYWFNTSYNPPENRLMTFLAYGLSAITGEWEEFEFEAEIQSGSYLKIVLPPTDPHYFPSGSWITGASSDDSSHGNSSVSLPATSFNGSPSEPVTFILEWQNPEKISDTTYYIRAVNYHLSQNYAISVPVYYFNTSSGDWATRNYSFYQFGQQDDGCIRLSTQLWDSFPQGSHIVAGSADYYMPDFMVHFQWDQFDFEIT